MLAVFAVQNNLNSDSDVVVINAAQKQRIQDAFWAMHEITYEVEEVDTTPEPTEDAPEPEQQTEYILHITVNSKTVDELAELYNFTQDQKDILHELLSDEMRPSLLALCGGTAVADGAFAGRCRGTLIYPATSGKWTPSATPGIAARTFPRRRAHPSWLPTAARF